MIRPTTERVLFDSLDDCDRLAMNSLMSFSGAAWTGIHPMPDSNSNPNPMITLRLLTLMAVVCGLAACESEADHLDRGVRSVSTTTQTTETQVVQPAPATTTTVRTY